MKNLADDIETFLISKLLLDDDDEILVRRNELADRLSCAPSQISYVLSTRFTPERGFIVESRRGSGGFVRIIRLLEEENKQEAFERKNKLEKFAEEKGLTHGEAVLFAFMLEVLEKRTQPHEKKAIIAEALKRVAATRKKEK
ncbi:MAG TPA: CtsR family transcriptional regulator [Candidatus Avacidaminococcus intestinavium]|uniref:CtsR family transcriptional regulator n=1 Tax=Candidatus Avacidaminococcus intestinavium TaxID=2840684 RepID=A0A9D1MPF5_9FIRM|nr:CtsR family transcriptional regulator [Candidatus Avacidaminococcus intestinavium]